MSWVGRRLFDLFNAAFVAFLLAPIVVVILVAFTPEGWLSIPTTRFSLRWFRAIAAHPEFVAAFWNSVVIGVLAAGVAGALGTMAAVAIVRSEWKGVGAVRSLLLAPLSVPAVIVGVSMLYAFSRIGLAGRFPGVVVAHIVLTLPYVTRAVAVALYGFDRRLELAAMSLGAGRLTAFFRVTLPGILPGLAAGAVFAFVVSFDELTVSLFVTGPQTVTLPVRIYTYITYTTEPVVAAVSTVIVLISLASVLLIERMVGLDRLLLGRAGSSHE